MKYITIKTNLETLDVSKFVFGTHNFGTEKCKSLKSSEELLNCYMDGGGNVIDTARSYAEGESEKHIGEWLRKKSIRQKKHYIVYKWGTTNSIISYNDIA